jgi:hypothetical protein
MVATSSEMVDVEIESGSQYVHDGGGEEELY